MTAAQHHFLKIQDGVDVTALLEQLAAAPDLWDSQRARKDAPGSAHTQMSDIWVRYNHPDKLANKATFNDEHVPVWYPAWYRLPALRPIVFNLMAQVEGEMIGGILITRIPPGASIAPHADRGWHVNYYDKFYTSLMSEPGADFGCEHAGVREILNPSPGETWRLDNRKTHWVENRSKAPRMTLITCIRTDMFERHR